MIGLWRNCSNVAHITAENPMGIARDLFASPLGMVREDWGPKLDAATLALGYRPDFMPWMPFGQKLITNVMCVDSYISLLKSGTGKPYEYQQAFDQLRTHCRTLYIYHGSPRFVAEVPTGGTDNYKWLSPTLLADAIPVFDAEGDKESAAMSKLASRLRDRGIPFAVEPFVKPGTRWAADGVPCFVLLSTVRRTIAADWAPAQGAVRDYPHTNVLVPDWEQLGEDEAKGYEARGWQVFYPINTPTTHLSKFKLEPTP